VLDVWKRGGLDSGNRLLDVWKRGGLDSGNSRLISHGAKNQLCEGEKKNRRLSLGR
jgi:hypothetical protein